MSKAMVQVLTVDGKVWQGALNLADGVENKPLPNDLQNNVLIENETGD